MTWTVVTAGVLALTGYGLHLYWCAEAVAVVVWQRRHMQSVSDAQELAELLPGVPALHDVTLANVELASECALIHFGRIPRSLRRFYIRLAAKALNEKRRVIEPLKEEGKP